MTKFRHALPLAVLAVHLPLAAQIGVSARLETTATASADAQRNQAPAGTPVPSGFNLGAASQACLATASLDYTETPGGLGGTLIHWSATSTRALTCSQSVTRADGTVRLELTHPFTLSGELQVVAGTAIAGFVDYSVDVGADGTAEVTAPPSGGSIRAAVPVTLGPTPTPVLVSVLASASGLVSGRRSETLRADVRLEFVPAPGRVSTEGAPCGSRTLTGTWVQQGGRAVRLVATGPGPQLSLLFVGVGRSAVPIPPIGCLVRTLPVVVLPVPFGGRRGTTTATMDLAVPNAVAPFDVRFQYVSVDVINNLAVVDTSQVVRVQYP